MDQTEHSRGDDVSHLEYVEAAVLAERMILANLTKDWDGLALVEAEVPGCAHCWAQVTSHLSWASSWHLQYHWDSERAAGFTSGVLLSYLDDQKAANERLGHHDR